MNAFDYFFENSAKLDKNFVLGSKETVSFKVLFRQVLYLATYLKKTEGTKKNILLIAPNSVFFITAYLAILKSGNIAVPLNPELEQDNLDYIQDQCESKLAFITEKLTKKLKLNTVSMISENNLNELLKSYNITVDSPEPFDINQPAEIIFTSGSTGKPKGVVISHKNLIANTSSIIEYLKLSPQDIMLVVLPFYYCYGLSLLHTHLRVGGGIVLNNMFMMLGGVINDLIRFNCTGFAGVPSHFQILLRKSDSFKNSHFPNLNYVTQAGGKLHNAFISEFIESFNDVRFIVMYGQTEATARLSWLPPEKLPEKIGSCGKSIPGVQLLVADESGKNVKPGETGEILAKGENIMLGYYKDPESTDQVLKNGWLHTGDLATVDEEGFIYLTARKKEIIKVGGIRISPKEIEEVIVSMPEVVDCTIESVYNEILGETMKATVVLKEADGTKITSDDIKKYCAERLVAIKIPQFIEINDFFLLTATGKKVKNSGK